MIKPIETIYKGYRFRSRLEARWAVFFDAIGISWEYEVEGYDLGPHGWYLPDFRVTTRDGDNVYYEIKPAHTSSDPKFDAFKNSLDKEAKYINSAQARMLSGDPMSFLVDDPKDGHGICPRCAVIGVYDYGVHEWGDIIEFGCGFCDAHTPVGGGNKIEDGVIAQTEPYKGALILREPYSQFMGKVEAACQKARSARFEHGESPQ